MVLKYPKCEICRSIQRVIGNKYDKQINDYHESKGSYELFPDEVQDKVIDTMLNFKVILK